MHHFDEVAAADRSGVQVTIFGGARRLFATSGARHVAAPRSKRFEDRIEPLHSRLRTADHHAIATFEAPHAAAGAYVHIVNASRFEFFGAADVVNVVGVAAVNDYVVLL